VTADDRSFDSGRRTTGEFTHVFIAATNAASAVAEPDA
jgi:hypothetical protein